MSGSKHSNVRSAWRLSWPASAVPAPSSRRPSARRAARPAAAPRASRATCRRGQRPPTQPRRRQLQTTRTATPPWRRAASSSEGSAGTVGPAAPRDARGRATHALHRQARTWQGVRRVVRPASCRRTRTHTRTRRVPAFTPVKHVQVCIKQETMERRRKREQTGKMSSLQTLERVMESTAASIIQSHWRKKREAILKKHIERLVRTARTAFIIFDESLSLITLAAALWVPRTARCLALRSRKCAPSTTPCPP